MGRLGPVIERECCLKLSISLGGDMLWRSVSLCSAATWGGLVQESTEELRLNQNEGLDIKERNPLPPPPPTGKYMGYYSGAVTRI